MEQALSSARKAPPKGVDARRMLSVFWQITKAGLVLAFLGWLIWRGIDAMDYRWQWFRVQPFFYRVIDGEIIWGPLVRGLIMTLQIASIAGVLAVLIGFVTALARMSGSFAGRIIATVYLEAILSGSHPQYATAGSWLLGARPRSGGGGRSGAVVMLSGTTTCLRRIYRYEHHHNKRRKRRCKDGIFS